LPSGAPLAVAVAVTAATMVMAAGPAAAGPVTHAAAAGDKIRASEWWLSSLHVTQAWQSSRGAGVTVALLSTGVLTSHPDLTGSVTTGPDVTGSGETAASSTWGIEGTSAASIIAGHGDDTGDASGIIGIAPAARILSIRVAFDAADALNASSSAVGRLPAAIAEGIRYAVAHGAKVIDLPLDPATLASDGAPTGGLAAAAGGSAAERSAISYAISRGVVLVAPAGDNGDDGDTASFPASYPGVIALGAVDKHGGRAGFSTRQSYVAMTAPGVDVTAASRPAGYRTMSTSDAASAIVAGIAALIRSRYPSLASSQVRQALLAGSASPPGSGTAGDGAGTVDALKAIQAAAAIASPRPTAQASTPAATAPARVQPLTSHPKPGTLGMARSALRDAAAAAGGLIVLLLGILLGLRLWRRRAEQETRSGPEPRTLLGAPSGPPSGPLPIQPSSARHARVMAAEGVLAPSAPPVPGPVPAGAPGPGSRPGDAGQRPDFMSPRFAPPGGMPVEPGGPDEASDAAPEGRPADRGRIRNRGRAGHSGPGTRISPHNLRPRVTPATRTAARGEVSAPGGPPWEPAPAPANELLHEPQSGVHDRFRPPARPAPAVDAPWGATALEPLALPPAPPGPPAPPVGFAGSPPGTVPPQAGREAPPPAGDPGTPARPISPLDRLLLPEPGQPQPGQPQPGQSQPGQPEPGQPEPGQPGPYGPRPPLGPPGPTTTAGPPGPAAPPSPWRVPGSSGRFPGAGDDGEAAAPPPGWPQDAYPGRTGRLTRPGEFLPPYAGRPPRVDEPEPGPAPEGPQPPRDRAGQGPGDSPSGPLYIWNPAALTEPFPAGPETGRGDDDDPDPRRRT
jgi:subtilisin family serine protease